MKHVEGDCRKWIAPLTVLLLDEQGGQTQKFAALMSEDDVDIADAYCTTMGTDKLYSKSTKTACGTTAKKSSPFSISVFSP